MADGFSVARQNGIPEVRIVQSTIGKPYRGFLLTKTFTNNNTPLYHALYTDGVVEEINPAGGFPRPDPDPAERTKGFVIPSSLQGAPNDTYKPSSRFSGLIRQVVQCEYSRGQDTKFSYTWGKTHGILEFPVPRQIGSTKGLEAERLKQRKFFLIEISPEGVFAAPVKIGVNCLSCALMTDYLPTAAQIQENPGWATHQSDISLAWAADFSTGKAKIQRLMTAAQIAPAYANGSPWTSQIGWAFSQYGTQASNVVAKLEYAGYKTTLYTVGFSVKIDGFPASISLVEPGVAEVVQFSHGFSDGGLAVITGANEPEYNGAHVITLVNDNIFRFNITGTPTSPATGSIVVANGANDATVTATLTTGASGKCSFSYQSTVWVPVDSANWIGMDPVLQNVPDVQSGPVHVFYDGEVAQITNWSSTITQVPKDETEPIVTEGGTIPWNGTAGGTHWYGGERQVLEGVCQAGDVCSIEYDPAVFNDSGHSYSAYKLHQFGFTGGVNIQVDTEQARSLKDSTTIRGEDTEEVIVFGNFYTLCPDCYYSDPNGIVKQCSSTIELTYTFANGHIRDVENDRSVGGSSYLIIMQDRECIGGVKTKSTSESFQITDRQNSRLRYMHKEVKIDDGPCPFTDFEVGDSQFMGLSGEQSVSSSSNTSVEGQFAFKGKAGFGVSVDLSFGPAPFYPISTPDVADFTIFNATKNTANSGLFYMGNGLYHSDPNLEFTQTKPGTDPPEVTGSSVANQVSNCVFKLTDPSVTAVQGFAPLTAGKLVIGFVGLV